MSLIIVQLCLMPAGVRNATAQASAPALHAKAMVSEGMTTSDDDATQSVSSFVFTFRIAAS